LAPVTSTGVPVGSDWLVQPLVSVAAPVPEEWAAWPRETFEPSSKTKLDVHWAPLVNVITPGWTVADAAGAHAEAAGASAATPRAATVKASTMSFLKVRLLGIDCHEPGADLGRAGPTIGAKDKALGRAVR